MFGKYSYFLWQHLNPDQECEYKKCSVAEIMYNPEREFGPGEEFEAGTLYDWLIIGRPYIKLNLAFRMHK